jgi:hypothetical protein
MARSYTVAKWDFGIILAFCHFIKISVTSAQSASQVAELEKFDSHFLAIGNIIYKRNENNWDQTCSCLSS